MYHRNDNISQPLVFRTLHGELVAVRQVTAADTFLLADLLSRLSDRTRHLRYMSARHFSGEAIWREAARMTCGGSHDHTTLVATKRLNDSDEAIAVAELVRYQPDRTVGEIAMVVHDDEQRQGIGSFLLQYLVHLAIQGGLASLSANMLAENRAMLQLIRTLGLPYRATTSYGEIQVLVSLPGHREQIAGVRSGHKLAA